MRFLILIYGDESQVAGTPEEMAEVMPAWNAYGERYADMIRAGAPLQQSSTATTVRVRDGRVLHTDGPFAETREQLGGYYLVECDDLDQALAMAADCPAAPWGSVEVRPVMEIPGLSG